MMTDAEFNLYKKKCRVNPNLNLSAKQTIQNFHRNILRGIYEPCWNCNGTGRESLVDASGNNDWDDCSICGGWSVLKVVNNEDI